MRLKRFLRNRGFSPYLRLSVSCAIGELRIDTTGIKPM